MSSFIALAVALVSLIGFSVSLNYWGAFYDIVNRAAFDLVSKVPFFAYIAWFFSVPVYLFVRVFPYFLLLLTNEKRQGLKLFVWTCIEIALQHLLKLLYTGSRPCFQSDIYGNLGCACGFGTPSGHAMSTLFFFLLLTTDHVVPKVRGSWKGIFLALAAIMILGVGLSRISLGLASWTQVLLGYLWGLLLFGIVKAFDDVILDGFQALCDMVLSTAGKRMCVVVTHMLIILLLNLLVMVQWTRVTETIESVRPHPFSYTACGRSCLAKQAFIADTHLENTAFSTAAFFLLATWLVCPPRPTPFSQIFCGNQWNGAALAIKRILVFTLIVSPFLVAIFAGVRLQSWRAYFAICGLLLLFALLFRFLMLPLLTMLKSNIVGDFFCSEHGPNTRIYSILQENELANPPLIKTY